MSDDLRDLVRKAGITRLPRRLERPVVDIPLLVRAHGALLAGRVRDLNEHGVRLRLNKPLALLDSVRLDLRVPGLPTAITLPAEVRWVRPSEGPDEFSVGMEFRHTQSTRRALQRLLLEHAQGRLPDIRRTGHTTRRRVDPNTDRGRGV